MISTLQSSTPHNSLNSNTPKIELLGSLLGQCFEAVATNIENSWKDFQQKYENVQTTQQTAQPKLKKVPINQKKQVNKLRIKVTAKSSLKQDSMESNTKQQLSKTGKQQKQQKELPEIRTRTKSQTTQLKSLKKTNQIANQKEEEEKKVLRLKQIAKRKMELMQRLKKIDVELQQAKKDASPNLSKVKEEKSLYQSNLNRSFIANLSNSRMNRQASENVVQQHSKVVGVLERINNQKIKRQEKIAEEFRKKQQAELMKVQQLERKRNQQLEQKNKKNQVAIDRLKKQQKNKKVNQVKLNEFSEKNQNSLLPTTMIKTSQRNSFKDGLFFQQKSTKNLLTQRDADIDEQTHAKQFQNALIAEQVKKEQNKIEESLAASMINQQNGIVDPNQITLNPKNTDHHLII